MCHLRFDYACFLHMLSAFVRNVTVDVLFHAIDTAVAYAVTERAQSQRIGDTTVSSHSAIAPIAQQRSWWIAFLAFVGT